MKWAAGETWKGVQWCMASAPCKAAAKKYGTMALEDGMKSAAALQNLYGSSHSYLQNLCDGSDCNQMDNGSDGRWMQNMRMVQMDHDSSHDKFHTQNIDIKDIKSHGNVNVSLQELDVLQNLNVASWIRGAIGEFEPQHGGSKHSGGEGPEENDDGSDGNDQGNHD